MRPAVVPPPAAAMALPPDERPARPWRGLAGTAPPDPGTRTSTWPYNPSAATLPFSPASTTYPYYTQDPGIKNPYLAAASLPIQVPADPAAADPARRLFQVPDAYVFQTPSSASADHHAHPYGGRPRRSRATPASPATPTSTTSCPTTSFRPTIRPVAGAGPFGDLTARTGHGVAPAWLGNHTGIAYDATDPNELHGGLRREQHGQRPAACRTSPSASPTCGSTPTSAPSGCSG